MLQPSFEADSVLTLARISIRLYHQKKATASFRLYHPVMERLLSAPLKVCQITREMATSVFHGALPAL